MNNEYIEELAERVRRDLGLTSQNVNVDMNLVLDMLDITVNVDEFHEVEGSITDGENGYEITLSRFYDGSNRRDKFTLAHELGHLFLHFDPNDPKRIFMRKGETEEEYQANRFAAAFLMPQDIFEETLDRYAVENKVDMSKVAADFGVSVEAARNRGRFLGYLSWN